MQEQGAVINVCLGIGSVDLLQIGAGLLQQGGTAFAVHLDFLRLIDYNRTKNCGWLLHFTLFCNYSLGLNEFKWLSTHN